VNNQLVPGSEGQTPGISEQSSLTICGLPGSPAGSSASMFLCCLWFPDQLTYVPGGGQHRGSEARQVLGRRVRRLLLICVLVLLVSLLATLTACPRP